MKKFGEKLSQLTVLILCIKVLIILYPQFLSKSHLQVLVYIFDISSDKEIPFGLL